MIPLDPSILEHFKREKPTRKKDMGSINTLRQDTCLMLKEKLSPDAQAVIEIGSWLGRSAILMAGLAPGATIYAIDTWLGSVDLFEMRETVGFIKDSYELFLANTEEYQNQIRPMRIDSVNGMAVLYSTGMRRPDLIFIDAGHQYESALADTGAAHRFFPMTPIVFDDIDHDGVYRALKDVAADAGRPIQIQGCAGYMGVSFVE